MDQTELLKKIIKEIIKEQSEVVGAPLAKSRALSTGFVQFIDENGIEIQLQLNDEPKRLLTNLIAAYEKIFGQASVDVCLDVLESQPREDIEPLLEEEIITKLRFTTKQKV